MSDKVSISVSEEPTPLTIERVASMFEALGFNYELEENRIKTGFGNIPMAVYLDANGDYLVIRGFWWANLNEHGKAVANSVIAQKHAQTFFPTYFIIQDEDGFQVVGDVNLFVGPQGVTDSQMGAFVGFFEMLEKELEEVAETVTKSL
ncbi:hypothetical protein KRX54_01240 [Actinomycetaceae bacterium TAE3-ERU4]|nr:hypothetical protein [Actinomycetaceae bacterium TAE3-ERU4]